MPKVEALLLDLYGTLVDVYTNENKNEIDDIISRYLSYYDVNIDIGRLRSVFES